MKKAWTEALPNFTVEELQYAKNVSLSMLAEYLGFHPIRKGKVQILKEHDSLVIYNDRTWNRFSQKGLRKNGGTPIDFYIEFGDAIDIVDAVLKINQIFRGVYKPQRQEMRRQCEKSECTDGEFVLPEKAPNYRNLYAYLMKTRGLSSETVNYFVNELHVLYQDTRNNLVFVGKDKAGVEKSAFLRGTCDYYKKFQCDVLGSDKQYSVSIIVLESNTVHVFEAAIDLMSYIEMTGQKNANYVVLGCCGDAALERLLQDYDHIECIVFRLDNDKGGIAAAERYCKKYQQLGYTCTIELPKVGKDYNEMLQKTKYVGRENGNV